MMIVDFAVEDDGDGSVLVTDRLVAACDVDDAQAPHAHCHVFAKEITVGVRAPVLYGIAHRVEAIGGLFCRQPDARKSSDATHVSETVALAGRAAQWPQRARSRRGLTCWKLSRGSQGRDRTP